MLSYSEKKSCLYKKMRNDEVEDEERTTNQQLQQ
jgi:hypothetical protein